MNSSLRNVLLILLLSSVLNACKSPVQFDLLGMLTDESFEKMEFLEPNAVPGDSDPIQKEGNIFSTIEDSQGNVTVSVTPINFDNTGETIDFTIQMNTHSVDLNMDLAYLSTLTNDAENEISPIKWDAPIGGHHISGTLSFPGSIEGEKILDGAKTIKLTIRDVDAPERTFTWQLD